MPSTHVVLLFRQPQDILHASDTRRPRRQSLQLHTGPASNLHILHTRTLVESVSSPGEYVVHLVGHATRLRNEADGARSVQLARDNVIYGACSVTNLESASLGGERAATTQS